jgi:hypothetical protein
MYPSLSQVCADKRLFAYHHLIAVAWKELELDSVLCINGLPTVYIHRSKEPISARDAAELHKCFWNQGIATLLLLMDPTKFHVYSAQTFPTNPDKQVEIRDQAAQIESDLDLATLSMWFDRLCVQLETGAYYRNHATKFQREQTVDQYLLLNLSDTRDALTKGNAALSIPQAHAFLGRILFTCYLIDRGIIHLSDYFEISGKRLIDFLDSRSPAQSLKGLYEKLFPDLRKRLNGSMFDGDLETEQGYITPKHIEFLARFLAGDHVAQSQQSLGFWTYDFQMIPTETISGIYEDFLKAEDEKVKHKNGAFYTPRLLAEMTLDVLLENETGSLLKKRFLDPSCGSGIFLVLLFNRLAAEWIHRNPKKAKNYEVRAEALRNIFRDNLRGIDLNPTACHIACFSLYLAYLDQFDPRSIRQHCETIGKFLPNLITSSQSNQPKGRRERIPVIMEADFLKHTTPEQERFDYIIGNPPWAERGRAKSLEQRFMAAAPAHLKKEASGGFLLPSKVLLNKTNAFQGEWLQMVSPEKVVMLADYRMILFAKAKCPCMIIRFRNQPADAARRENRWIEYITPKVYGIETRSSAISVSPEDQKWIRPGQLLYAIDQGNAPNFWKSLFWGTPRDQKLLSTYEEFPSLGDFAGTPTEFRAGKKRWAKGQGFQPLKLGASSEIITKLTWPLDDTFIPARRVNHIPIFPLQKAETLGEYLSSHDYRLDLLHRSRDEQIYKPPLILFNQGFSHFAFFDYPVRFQHSLQSISGNPEDTDALLFLTAYLKSKLSYYFIFHTGANVGTERTKAQLEEVLNLPFFLPDFEFAPDNAASTLKKVAAAMRRLKTKLEKRWDVLVPEPSDDFILAPDTQEEKIKNWEAFAKKETERVMSQTINPLIYDYFDLIDQEVVLVEDTFDILRESITPGKLDNCRGTRQELDETAIQNYAEQLITTLHSWMLPDTPVRINAVCRINRSLGLANVELIQSKTAEPVIVEELSEKEAFAYFRLEQAATEEHGSLRYLRSIRRFDKDRIRIYKPARLGFWMRSTAINDASALHAEISLSGNTKK